jgi:hypothetical protein
VAWLDDGTPEFRAADARKFDKAIREKVCWVCGERLKRLVAFGLGPMCAITRTTAEPPAHLECAEWSVKACPFLAKPQMRRREGGALDEMPVTSSGVAIRRNPGVTAVWLTTRYSTFGDGRGGTLITVGDPVSMSFLNRKPSVYWWREGRPATRTECVESIESGLPFLYNADPDDPTARAEIDRRYEAMKHLLPEET